MTHNEDTAVPGTSQQRRTDISNDNAHPKNSKIIRKGTKLHNVISHLASGQALHRFQAERLCFDHVLPSTISGFKRMYGITVARKLITVPGHAGNQVTVAEYWLEPGERQKAQQLLEVA